MGKLGPFIEDLIRLERTERQPGLLEALDWNPELHPRDNEGKFTEKPGGGVVGELSPGEISNASEIEADRIEFESEDVGRETRFSFHALNDEIQFDMGVPKDGESAMAYHMWIDEKHRGEGVASELMNAAEMKAEEEDMEFLNATIGGDSEAASSFFESVGYEEGIMEDGDLIVPEGAEWAYAHKDLSEGVEDD